MKLFQTNGTNRLHGKYRKCTIDIECLSYGYFVSVHYRDENGVHKMNNINCISTLAEAEKEAVRMADKLRERYDNYVL